MLLIVVKKYLCLFLDILQHLLIQETSITIELSIAPKCIIFERLPLLSIVLLFILTRSLAQFTSDILTPEVGAIFREARLAKGLSVDDVAAKLRMNLHYIERIEAGDVRSLPPEPYRKAFIKEYARFVGIKLDAFHISDEARPDSFRTSVSNIPGVAKKVGKEVASIAEEVAQTTVKTTETVVKKAGEGVMDAVDELRSKDLWAEADDVRRERLGISNRNDKERELTIRRRDNETAKPEPAKPDELPKIITPLEISATPISKRTESRIPTQRINLDRQVREEAQQMPLPEQDFDADGHSGMSRSTKIIVALLIVIAGIIIFSVVSKRSKLPEQPVVTEPTQTKPQAPIKKEVPKVVDTNKVVPIVPNDSTLLFTLTAKDSVWVSVTPDVGTGFRGKMKAGETKQFTAKEKYIIYLGNQKSVSMTLNGRPLTGLPTVAGSNMVVRNVLLTKDKAVIAPSDQTPTVVKQQAIKKDTAHKKPVPKPVKKQLPVKKTVKPTPKPQTPLVKKPTPGVKKTIPTTPPVLPSPN